ncbi:MAG: S-methyl-5-thioribose-1-phosphate isomerase [Gammaproteobacteria bacterium]|nr:S-methyl-5-thioribose-1-phosphate isomerase [Gammaproteobacteria bacterium]
MNVDGEHFRSIWFDESDQSVRIIDQTRLPHFFEIIELSTFQETCHAIHSMQVRGAPLIGATAAFGIYLALQEGITELDDAARQLIATRPTAVNLQWAISRVMTAIGNASGDAAQDIALATAQSICEEDVSNCTAIGEHGVVLIRELAGNKQGPVNILTHCNAGWLATVDRGTALAPVYRAWEEGIELHVWVDETRPRNQGSSLTAWELVKQGIPHTVISDNTGGHLMQTQQVDICLVGSDRTTFRGNVCNKIGTYLKALAAHDNEVPFYVAVPLSSIDWDADNIPIEERDNEEITRIRGLNDQGELDSVRLTPEGSAALNIGFDITPGKLVSGLITEKGIVAATEEGIASLRETTK